VPIATHTPDTDLLLPLPRADEQWDPCTIHTHYFGLTVPEAQLGGFLYVRYMPSFPLSQGGVCLFRGMDNPTPLDMEFLDYEMTMPWPTVEGSTITTANGLRIEFTEPGRCAHVSYRSADGRVEVELDQVAVTPLLVRGHIIPGEDDHHDPARDPGGSEQFMRCTGSVRIDGERFSVDCHHPRDRSWRQVRKEVQGGARRMPPIGWSPMYFGPDLVFNQISFEAADTAPAWTGLFDMPKALPAHHYAWVYDGTEVLKIERVRRNVLAYHPITHMAIRQEIEATDERSRVYRFTGEAIATSAVPAWPNAGFHDSVYRWQDELGRITHCTYQELWADTYQRAMRRRAQSVPA
jgi:hypothetical protein